MNRAEAKEFYPILQAFAEGKVIEPMKLITDLQKEENMTRKEAKEFYHF